jgi:uncharacterized protein HemX
MPPTSKQAPQGAKKNPKNTIIAAVAVLAIVLAGVMLYYQFAPTPPPPENTNVMSGATAEEKTELNNQQKLHQSLEKKVKPAGA